MKDNPKRKVKKRKKIIQKTSPDIDRPRTFAKEATNFPLEVDLQRFLDKIPSLLGYWDANLVNRISNEAYASYFGKKPSEIQGRHIKELLGLKLYKTNLPYITAALSGEAQTFEREIPSPDGSVKETIANYIPDIVDGKVIGFFVIVVEIGLVKMLERKNRSFEARLVASSKMYSLGKMAGSIAHEINNPLSIIYANACHASKLLRKKDLDLKKVQTLIDEIESTSRRIETTIEGLRNFSGDSLNQTIQRVSAASIIQSTLSLCETRIINHGIDLSVIDLDSTVFLRCRPVQISQILLNLLNNAFDAVENWPTKSIRISVKSEGKFACFTVSNSGPKISSKITEKIFQPFFTTKEIGKGTGLGLSISRGLAEGHKGSLNVDLKSKKTSFILRIPKE